MHLLGPPCQDFFQDFVHRRVQFSREDPSVSCLEGMRPAAAWSRMWDNTGILGSRLPLFSKMFLSTGRDPWFTVARK